MDVHTIGNSIFQRTNWTVVMRIEPKRKLSATLLALVGLDKIIPATIFQRLDRPNSGGVLYLRPSNESASSAHSVSQ